jgi:hypothetical protein
MIKLQISRTDKHEDQTESRILIFGKCATQYNILVKLY